ncbi:MAG: helix-turn-helix domain-containing protein [Bryobacteraceae bacterium]|jgi:predicted DNA-binding transcriptional regulator AlpA
MTGTEKKLLTEKEVAELYGLSAQFLQKARMRREGPPFVKVAGRIGQRGGRIRYRPQDVDAWVASRLVRTEALDDRR